MWNKTSERLPEEKGRYLIMTTFKKPVFSLGKETRENVPFVSTYTPEKGWLSAIKEQEVTHWMEIPPL